MTVVKPSDIEHELSHIWGNLTKKNKMRACLFTLIIYNKLSKRTDYLKSIVNKVIEKFPCRVILISNASDSKESYLNTSVSVIPTDDKDSNVVCDFIDITVAGDELKKVPFLILPHLVPDLPIYLLWADDPCLNDPLLKELKKLSSRTIFDSECTTNLFSFAKMILDEKLDVADLNWGRIESWRHLFISNFHPKLYFNDLKKATTIKICYNSHTTDFFTHPKIQAIYFQAWLAQRLNWKLSVVKNSNNLVITYLKEDGKPVEITLIPQDNVDLKSATIISVEILTSDKNFQYLRDKKYPHQITLHITEEKTCAMPMHFFIEKTHAGQSLVKEIYYKGTSKHYLKMLNQLLEIQSHANTQNI